MTIGEGLPPPMAYPVNQDPKHQLYGFHCDDWEKSPIPTWPDFVSDEERKRRNANANAYRQYGNPSDWSRYLTLGYFALEDCGKFEKIWKKFR